ncbi:putative beta-lactamase-like 1 [Saccostrea cucullata]|uniref:putative beta-lactamase-like 1 n=1 Tax=Saccostrea cuccullata TaxID=36930 RepID=UPI002ED14435
MAALRFFLIFASVWMCQSQQLLQMYLKTTLENAYRACRAGVNPGLAVAVVKDGQVQFTHALGVKDKAYPMTLANRVTTNTKFGIGSLSQVFANVLTLTVMNSTERLRKKGIDTTLRNYFQHKGLFKHSYLRSRYATLLDLMTHRMGFENHKYLRLNLTMTRDKIMMRVHHMNPKGRFRDSFYYNDLMYGIIAKISEDIDTLSLTWEDMLRKYVLNPLGIPSTTFFTTLNPLMEDVARGYVEDEGLLYPVPYEFLKVWTRFCGDSCVLSSANDMARFMIFLLGNGTIPGSSVPLIDQEDFKYMFKPWNRIQSPSVEDYFSKAEGVPVTRTHSGVGLGVKTGIYRGWKIVEQAGDLFGYSTIMTLFPETNLGIFIAMSGEDKHDFFRTTLASYIADLYHKETPWLNSTLLCAFPSPWKVPPAPKAPLNMTEVPLNRPITDYVGTYVNELYGALEVREVFGRLELNYGLGQFDLKRKDSTKPRFHMIPKGLSKHVIDISSMKFREQRGTNLIESANINMFEDADFMKVGVPAQP